MTTRRSILQGISTIEHRRLFRVYFSVAPHVPAHSYRHVLARDFDDARTQVDDYIAKHAEELDALDFRLGTIQEENIRMLDSYLKDSHRVIPSP